MKLYVEFKNRKFYLNALEKLADNLYFKHIDVNEIRRNTILITVDMFDMFDNKLLFTNYDDNSDLHFMDFNMNEIYGFNSSLIKD